MIFFFVKYIVGGPAVNVLNQINRNTPSPMSQNGKYKIIYLVY